LRLYLQRHGVPAREIEQLVVEGTRQGFLDDAACAKLWATHLSDRGYACAAVRERLAAKGLSAGVIERVVRPLEIEQPDAARVREALRAQRSRAARQDARSRARLIRWLARRGYDTELIETALGDVAAVD